MTLDLTDEEAAALLRLLKTTVRDARFPLAPSLDPYKAILAKIEPPRPEAPPPVAPMPYAGPTRGARGRERR